jgi:RNA polymerase subunit RPABC4/transcription elongation factor Spt4
MLIKMKQCDDCYYLCSNSASKCQVCGSTKLVNGTFITIENTQKKQQEQAIKYNESIVT